jgi:adenylyltransferase/sulfurtransferase
METGHVPTNATTASVIAGIQVQEAVKLLVGRDDLVALHNRAFQYTGDVMDAYTVDYVEDEYCLSHDHYADIASLEVDSTVSARDVLHQVVGPGTGAVLGFEDDLILSGSCHQCGRSVDLLRYRGALGPGSGECTCGAALTLEATRTLAEDDPVAVMPLGAWALPMEELVTVRTSAGRRHFALRFEERPSA